MTCVTCPGPSLPFQFQDANYDTRVHTPWLESNNRHCRGESVHKVCTNIIIRYILYTELYTSRHNSPASTARFAPPHHTVTQSCTKVQPARQTHWFAFSSTELKQPAAVPRIILMFIYRHHHHQHLRPGNWQAEQRNTVVLQWFMVMNTWIM